MFANIRALKENVSPLWYYLQNTTNTNVKGNWNKYLYDKRGKFVQHFKPKEEPEDFKDKIEQCVYLKKLTQQEVKQEVK